MPDNLIDAAQSAVPVAIVSGGDALDLWLVDQPDRIGNWVAATGFEANSGSTCLIAN